MALFGNTSGRLLRIRSRNNGFAGGGDSVVEANALSPQLNGHPGHLYPGSRELRSQAVHRLQVGMFGLAAMLLLVSLASVIMQRVQTADRSAIAAGPTPSASAASANDPLVDLGVAPEVPVDANGAAHKPTKPAGAH